AFDPELGARDLRADGDNALTDLGRGGVHADHRAALVAQEPNSCGRKVVEAVRVAHVLESRRKADTPADPFADREVPRASGQRDRIARDVAFGAREVGTPPLDLVNRRTALDSLIRHDGVAVPHGVAVAKLDRLEPDLG